MTSAAYWPLPTGEPEESGLCTRRLQRIHTVMEGFVSARTIAGGITAVARNGRLVHAACHGVMDAEQQIPMREDALFRIHSMTKPITTVAALMLYEECAFFLDDPLQQYLPAFADAQVATTREDGTEELVEPWRPITIHDVMTHTAGFTYDLVPKAPGRGWDLAAFVAQFARVPLIHQPGREWAYSASHDVLGHLVEVISEQPLDVFLRERIFAPLGMTDTDFHVPPEKQDRLAVVYELDEEDHIVPAAPGGRDYLHKPRFFSGGGGLVASTADYLRFCLMLLNGGALDGQQLLSRKTVELMRQDHLPPGHPGIEPFKFGYGLGVSVLRSLGEKQGIGSVGEFGWGGAASTDMWIDPVENMVSLVMMQLRPPRRLGLTKKIKDAMYQALV
ncbi:MAG TPA: serine hydrolase domain-containing protein [Candidatus Latescibacteria bacterium]|nr:serine hydrolase domain-containing protein [Candidatus Latescibacterota bacterium]HJP32031.1 serine hydrolase domain-containing protein [Candidatus Latescibacterota bacterium]